MYIIKMIGWETWLIVIGLVFDIVGAYFIGYDIRWMFRRRLDIYANLGYLHEIRKNFTEDIFKTMQSKNLGYSTTEIIRRIEQSAYKYLEKEKEEEERVEKIEKEHAFKSIKKGLLGFLFLSLGLLFQTIGIIAYRFLSV